MCKLPVRNTPDNRRTRSIPSLVAGVGIGALYAYGGYLLKNNRRYAIETALGASMILAGAQFPRAINTQKSLPIALSTLAVVAGGYYGKKWYEFRYGV